MPLYKLRIEAADLEAGQTAADLLAEPPAPPALAITLFELKRPAFVVEAYYHQPPPIEAIAGLLSPTAAKLGYPVLNQVPDENWVAVSQAALPPVRVGRFVLHGAHDQQHFAMHRYALQIDAGEAFGTGHNATTVLCLEALDLLSRRYRFERVLDLGCGTGVLAIAAARAMPDARVIASDNDPIAVAIARENVRLNRVCSRVRLVTASGLHHPLLRQGSSFDLALSNLLPGPLVALGPHVHRALAPSGVAVLSGLLAHQVREVLGSYRARGFRLLHQAHRDGWAALTIARS